MFRWDLGMKENGLIHISQLNEAFHFLSFSEVVSIGQNVRVSDGHAKIHQAGASSDRESHDRDRTANSLRSDSGKKLKKYLVVAPSVCESGGFQHGKDEPYFNAVITWLHFSLTVRLW